MFSRLLTLFILVPIAELAVFYLLGSKLGLLNTLAIILITAIIGAALTKSQGLRVLRDFHRATSAGELPHAPIIEGLIILVAGALLLTPGFLTDTIGFLALAPPIRKQIRLALTSRLGKWITVVTPATGANPTARRERVDDDQVIDV